MSHIIRFIVFVLTVVFITSCDDGEVDVQSFNFDNQPLSYCQNDQSLLFHVSNSAATEAVLADLSLNLNDLLNPGVLSYALSPNGNIVAYRIFDGASTPDYFCSAIPPTSPGVVKEYLAESGTAEILVVVTQDDLDGVPTQDELPEDQDSDADGIFDFIDADDDGDNVPTAFELDVFNADGDNDPLTNPLDTDGDGLPNYLDPDDDGDGVLTIDEDLNGDLDPTNDFTDPVAGPDYLNSAVSLETYQPLLREHTYQVVSGIELTLVDLVLNSGGTQLIKQLLPMGSLPSFLTSTIILTPIRD